MKFIVLKENLEKALAVTGRSISTKSQLPILSFLLIEAKGSNVIFSANNLELGVVFTIPAKVEQEGTTAVPGKLLFEFVNSITAEKVECTLTEKNFTLVAGKTRASFTTTNHTDFPTLPDVVPTKNILPFPKIKAAITRVAFASSTDETRPVLTGVRTTITNGVLMMTATDGYRLSREEVKIPEYQSDFSAIIPAQSLTEIVRIATDLKTEEIGLTVLENKNQVVFSLPSCHIYTRLIDGEFPGVDKIIPTGFKTRVVVERDIFTQAVKTASLFARGAANIVKVVVEKDGLRLSANTPQVGEDTDFIEAKVEGEGMEVAFNFRFLLDLLANFPDEAIVFESTGALNPGLFRTTKASSTFIHIIMPVRVQG
jgi:DNA polymerase III subunit beta